MEISRDYYIEVLKSAALDAGKRAVMAFIVKKIPFFALPVVNPIMGMIVGYILEVAIKYTEMGAFFTYIDLRTSMQGKKFEKAAFRNFIAQKEGTDEDKKQAEADLMDAFRDFARLTS